MSLEAELVIKNFFENLKVEIIKQPTDATPSVVEEKAYTDEQLEIEIKIQKLKERRNFNETQSQNGIERKKYALWIFRFTCGWSFSIFLIIFLVGFEIMEIDSSVLIALITTTSINAFGFFLLVVKYLFNTSPNSHYYKKKNNSEVAIK